MYRLGQRRPNPHNQATKWVVSFCAMLVLLAAGGWIALQQLAPDTTIQNSKAVVRSVAANTPQKVHIDQGLFSFDLPGGWKKTTLQNQPSNSYAYQGTGATDSARLFMVYVDNLPDNFAVNNVLAVDGEGVAIGHGQVSDNCASFTTTTSTTPVSGVAQSRWDDVNFYCDIGNSSRHVTGTSSKEAINKVTLTSAAHGSHSFFFTYTDNNINPDYTPLYNALESFRLN